jgi:hypothetical protein
MAIREIDTQEHDTKIKPQQYYSIDTFVDNTAYVITWQKYEKESGGWNIYANRLNKDGQKQNSEFLVHTTTIGDQINPAIQFLSSDSYIIAWQSYKQDSGWDIYARKLNVNGANSEPEFLVNTIKIGDQINPAITAISENSYVITWQSYGQDTDGWGIYARTLDAITGINSGSEILINSTIAGDQIKPAAISLSDGSYVITWQSYGQDGGWDIYARTFDATGKAGSEIPVNTTTARDQINPAITAISENNYVIAWQSYGQDGGGWGIYAQKFHVDGTKSGPELPVNTTTAGDQINPAITAISENNYVIAWQSYDEENKVWGVYQQVFHISGAKQGLESAVNDDKLTSQSRPLIASFNDSSYTITWINETVTWINETGNANDTTIFQNAFRYENTPPTAKDFSFSVLINQKSLIDFSPYISDAEEEISALQIKITNPQNSCGTFYYDAVNAITFGTPYASNTISYSPGGCTENSAAFKYQVCDAAVLCSNPQTLTFAINLYPENKVCYDEQICVDDSLMLPKNPAAAIIGLTVTSIVGCLGWLGWIIHCICQRKKFDVPVNNKQHNRKPIGISLENEDEIELINLANSSTYFKYDGVTLVKTSWISGKNALLVYDHDGSKTVNDDSKIVFTTWAPNAKSDFEAFLTAVDATGNKLFDSNGDGIFDGSDEKFDQFYLWQDKNENGIVDAGEFMSLIEAGLKSIDFNSMIASDISGMLNTADVYWTNGKVTTAGDLVFTH